MAAYVLKQWEVSQKPNDNGFFIELAGRRPGLVSWILSIIGIEATVRFSVSDKSVIHASGSWAGIKKRIIPLTQISSLYYGFTRPWKVCLSAFTTSVFLVGSMMASEAVSLPIGLGIVLVVGVVCLAYYTLNKRLSVGIRESGGMTNAVEFKGSVIEGKKIEEHDARMVCDIIQALMKA
jgi:hypothetical protein